MGRALCSRGRTRFRKNSDRRATVALLRLNDSTRLLERQALADAGRYPLA